MQGIWLVFVAGSAVRWAWVAVVSSVVVVVELQFSWGSWKRRTWVMCWWCWRVLAGAVWLSS